MRGASTGRFTATLVFVAAALAAHSVLAHHSPARYDLQTQRTVEGSITQYEWGNPHVYLFVRENGADRVWTVEAYPSTAMKQYGWAKDTFAAGDRVVVVGNPGRAAASSTLFLRSVRKADAAVALYDAGDAIAPPAPPARETFRAATIAGTWVSSVGPVFANFFGPGLAEGATPRGAAAIAEFRDDAANPGLDCVPFAPPVYMILPGFRRIEIRSDTVVIRGEDAAVERTVHLGATHDGAGPSVHGHSIGRWDGGTLVVDTTQFALHRLGNGAGLPSGPRKHLVERLAVNAEGGLDYSFELEDPDYLEQRVTRTTQWRYRPDVEYVATPCDRDNAKRFLAE